MDWIWWKKNEILYFVIFHLSFFFKFFAESGQTEFLELSGNVVPTFGNDIIAAHFVHAGIGFHKIGQMQLYTLYKLGSISN